MLFIHASMREIHIRRQTTHPYMLSTPLARRGVAFPSLVETLSSVAFGVLVLSWENTKMANDWFFETQKKNFGKQKKLWIPSGLVGVKSKYDRPLSICLDLLLIYWRRNEKKREAVVLFWQHSIIRSIPLLSLHFFSSPYVTIVWLSMSQHLTGYYLSRWKKNRL